MEEAAIGVRAPAKGKALAAALIPCEPAGFETYETPGIGAVEATSVSTLAGVETSVEIGGITVTAA